MIGWFIAIMFLVCIGFGVAFLIIEFRQREPPIETSEIRLYGYDRYTNGHNEGRLLNQFKGKDRTLFTYQPYLSDKDKKLNDIKFLEPLEVVVENNKVDPHPAGTMNSGFDIIECLPHNVNDLDENFKKTSHGQALMLMVETKNLQTINNEIESLRKNNAEEMAKKVYGLEIFADSLKDFEIINKDMKNMAQDKTKSSTTFTGNQNLIR